MNIKTYNLINNIFQDKINYYNKLQKISLKME